MMPDEQLFQKLQHKNRIFVALALVDPKSPSSRTQLLSSHESAGIDFIA